MLKIIPSLSAGALALMVLTFGSPPAANAQADSVIGYMGGRAALPSCPALEWRILPTTPGVASDVNGVAYFSDMSGISTIKGSVDASGKVTGMITSVAGKGPAGSVTGQREKNITHVEIHGTGCSAMKLEITRWTPGTPLLSDGD